MKTGATLYFYRPIAIFGGKILKCAGICTESGFKLRFHWFVKDAEEKEIYLPGGVILNGYRGDRIHADTYLPFN